MLDHFGLLAPIYDKLVPPPDVSRLGDLLRLPTTGRLLDAGGGTGRVTSQLRSLVGELVLTDVSAGMLQQAQQKADIDISQAHAERLPFPDASFDRVLVVDALHHFCDQELAIADLLRVLKPGGRLVIEEPDLNRFSVKMIAVAEKIALMRSHFYYPTEISAIIADHGQTAHIESDDQVSVWVVVDK
jgi:ubiquinone/menaquinone biosynthesis C-methylase UbiE